jgi:hypothetical protein
MGKLHIVNNRTTIISYKSWKFFLVITNIMWRFMIRHEKQPITCSKKPIVGKKKTLPLTLNKHTPRFVQCYWRFKILIKFQLCNEMKTKNASLGFHKERWCQCSKMGTMTSSLSWFHRHVKLHKKGSCNKFGIEIRREWTIRNSHWIRHE